MEHVVRRAAWIIFGGVVYLLAWSVLGRLMRDVAQSYDPRDPYHPPLDPFVGPASRRVW